MSDKRFDSKPTLDPKIAKKLIDAQNKRVFSDLEALDEDLSSDDPEPAQTSQGRCMKEGCNIPDQCSGHHEGFLDLLPDQSEGQHEDWEKSGVEGAQFIKPLSDTFDSAVPDKVVHHVDLGCGLTSCQEEHLVKEIWKLIRGLSLNVSPKSVVIKRRDGEHAEDNVPSTSGRGNITHTSNKRSHDRHSDEGAASTNAQFRTSKPNYVQQITSQSKQTPPDHDEEDEPGVLYRFRKGFILNPFDKSKKVRRFDLNTPGFGIEDIKKEFGSITNVPDDDTQFLVRMLKRNKNLNLVLMRYDLKNICLGE